MSHLHDVHLLVRTYNIIPEKLKKSLEPMIKKKASTMINLPQQIPKKVKTLRRNIVIIPQNIFNPQYQIIKTFFFLWRILDMRCKYIFSHQSHIFNELLTLRRIPMAILQKLIIDKVQRDNKSFIIWSIILVRY